MTLLLNDEQKMLKAAARDFFSARLPVAALRRLRDADDANGFDRAAWREMADLGWAGVLVPEACPGIPDEVLNPKSTWTDGAGYDAQALDLRKRFEVNFKQFETHVDDNVNAAAIRAAA